MQDTRVQVLVQEVYSFVFIQRFFLKYITATGKHTLFTHNNRGETESDGDNYLLLTHVLIHTLRYYH